MPERSAPLCGLIADAPALKKMCCAYDTVSEKLAFFPELSLTDLRLLPQVTAAIEEHGAARRESYGLRSFGFEIITTIGNRAGSHIIRGPDLNIHILLQKINPQGQFRRKGF